MFRSGMVCIVRMAFTRLEPAWRFGSEIRADFASGRATTALSVGFTSGVALLVAQIAIGSFIFSGELAPYSTQGIGLILFGNFASCLLVALMGGFRGAIAGLPQALVLGMAVIAHTGEASGINLFVTVCVAFMASAMIVGLCCLLIGRYRLTHMVRFIPFPVAAGVVAGIGGAVCLAALSFMGVDTDSWALATYLEPVVLSMWLPGSVLALGLFVAMKRTGKGLVLPIGVAVSIVAFQLALVVFDISHDEARTMGILHESTTEGGLWPALLPADLKRLEWSALLGQIPNMLALVLTAFIAVILGVAGVEMAANVELDWNREFKATGIASLVSGLGGGTATGMIVPATLRSKYFGATSRLTGLIAAAVIGLALLFGDGIVKHVPTFVTGGVLMFAGLAMVNESLVRNKDRIPGTEFGIVVCIFLVIVFMGLIEGVATGMLATLAFFVVRLSRVNPIESRVTVRTCRSNKDRSIPDRAILTKSGDRAVGYRLRGYIFFGSASRLNDRLRLSLQSDPAPICLILDFTDVQGVDFSVVSVLSRFLQAAKKSGVDVVMSSVSDQLRQGLERNLPPQASVELALAPDFEDALAHAEKAVIAAWWKEAHDADGRRAELFEHVAPDLEQFLDRQIEFEGLMDELDEWLAPRTFARHEVLAETVMQPDSTVLLLSGQASAFDGKGTRLLQFSPGDVVWPPAAFSAQAAKVVADETCRTMELTSTARKWLEANERELTLGLYRYLLFECFGAGDAASRRGLTTPPNPKEN